VPVTITNVTAAAQPAGRTVCAAGPSRPGLPAALALYPTVCLPAAGLSPAVCPYWSVYFGALLRVPHFAAGPTSGMFAGHPEQDQQDGDVGAADAEHLVDLGAVPR